MSLSGSRRQPKFISVTETTLNLPYKQQCMENQRKKNYLESKA